MCNLMNIVYRRIHMGLVVFDNFPHSWHCSAFDPRRQDCLCWRHSWRPGKCSCCSARIIQRPQYWKTSNHVVICKQFISSGHKLNILSAPNVLQEIFFLLLNVLWFKSHFISYLRMREKRSSPNNPTNDHKNRYQPKDWENKKAFAPLMKQPSQHSEH